MQIRSCVVDFLEMNKIITKGNLLSYQLLKSADNNNWEETKNDEFDPNVYNAPTIVLQNHL